MNRWEFSKARSNYHFDPTVKEDKGDNVPFRILGNASGVASRYELERSKNEGKTYNYLNRGAVIAGRTDQPFTDPYDRKEMDEFGVSYDKAFFSHLKVTDGGLMEKLKAAFQFSDGALNASYHVQLPGQFFPYHVDELPGFKNNEIEHELDKDPLQVARFEIMVYDWVPGHVWAYGNTYWKQWKAGDIAWHNWRDIPHGTANLSHSPRVTLQVTGRTSQYTRDIVNSGNLAIDLGFQLR